MAKGDLNRVPDGELRRTLENGLHIVGEKSTSGLTASKN